MRQKERERRRDREREGQSVREGESEGEREREQGIVSCSGCAILPVGLTQTKNFAPNMDELQKHTDPVAATVHRAIAEPRDLEMGQTKSHQQQGP